MQCLRPIILSSVLLTTAKQYTISFCNYLKGKLFAFSITVNNTDHGKRIESKTLPEWRSQLLDHRQ